MSVSLGEETLGAWPCPGGREGGREGAREKGGEREGGEGRERER